MPTLEQLQNAQSILDEWNSTQALRSENGITLTFEQYWVAIAEYDKREARRQNLANIREFTEQALPLLDDMQKSMESMSKALNKDNSTKEIADE